MPLKVRSFLTAKAATMADRPRLVNGNCLERIQQYIDIDQEPLPKDAGKPPAYWPASGDLRVENLSARYSLVSAPTFVEGLRINIL